MNPQIRAHDTGLKYPPAHAEHSHVDDTRVDDTPSPAPHGDARIGPNALTRVAEVLCAQFGPARAVEIFSDAGLLHRVHEAPQDMVPQSEVTRLHGVLRRAFGEEQARAIGREAGARTADYLLANRIPRVVQALLRTQPSRIAARGLSAAISRNAWTFAGSGRFTAHPGRPTVLSVAGCPICRDAVSDAPLCDYYAGTFERLFCGIVDRRMRVVETACEARGDPACVFEIRW